jgi:hypothetical protein
MKEFYLSLIEAFKTVFGFNHEQLMIDAYNSLTPEEKKRLDSLVESSIN